MKLKKAILPIFLILHIVFSNYVNASPLESEDTNNLAPEAPVVSQIQDPEILTDDYGNSIETAFDFKINEEISGNISYPDDKDVFRVTVNDQAMFKAYSTGSTDSLGTLLDVNGDMISSDDDSGDLKNFCIEKELDPGIYYICLSDCYPENVGDYVLVIEATPISADDYGSTIDSSSLINLGEPISGNIERPGDIDFFKIVVVSNILITVSTDGTTDTLGTLLDDNGREIITDDDSGNLKNFMFSTELEPGTYFISVKDYYQTNVGTYTLSTLATPLSADDYGNTIDSSSLINLGENISGSIERPGDIDFFKIVVVSSLLIKVSTDGSTDTLGALLDENGREIITDDDSGNLKNFMFSIELEPGTYFISVKDYYQTEVGTYTLSAIGIPLSADDYGNTIDSSRLINLGEPISGSIERPNDLDFFKFTLNSELKIEASTSGDTDTFGIIYNENGEVIASNDDDGIGKNLKINTNLSIGTYYLAVKHYYETEIGDYTLTVSSSEPDDSIITPLNEGDSNTCGFAYDGERFAYIGCNTTPARIVKFDIKEMSRITSLDLPANENRDECRVAAIIWISPSILIHASFNSPCVFTKIDPETMEITGTLVGQEGNDTYRYIRSMVYDGSFVYAATYSDPAALIKFDPVTMTIVDSYRFTAEEATNIHKITLIGDYIVGVCDGDMDSDSKIFRIKKDAFHEPVDSMFVSGISNYHSVCSDGEYVYAASDSNPIRVVKIDPLGPEITHLGTFEGITDTEAGNYSIVYDGTNVIVGTWNFGAPDMLIKINPVTMEKISSKLFLPSYPADLNYIDSFIYTCTDNSTGNVVRVKY